jgi:hypothetical protein
VLSDTRVTDAGEEWLKSRLPHCSVLR